MTNMFQEKKFLLHTTDIILFTLWDFFSFSKYKQALMCNNSLIFCLGSLIKVLIYLLQKVKHRRQAGRFHETQRGKCENKLSTCLFGVRCASFQMRTNIVTHTEMFVFTVLRLSSSGPSAVRISFSASMSSSLMA